MEILILVVLVLFVLGAHGPRRGWYGSPSGVWDILSLLLLLVLIWWLLRLAGVVSAEALYAQVVTTERVQARLGAEEVLTIGGVVTVLTQIIKWGMPSLPDSAGLLIVFVCAAIGVGLWGVSNEPTWAYSLVWPYFAAWVTVAATAAGIFGFVRAASAYQVTRTSPPPSGP
jgi:hypothetical protein